MKVGIITFHRALNYGALLQAFALRHSLSKLGAEAQILDYRNSVMEDMYSYPSFSQRKSIKYKVKFLIQGKSELKRRAKFENYRNKYLNLSNELHTEEEMKFVSDKYDKLITGSDQVWNYGAHNFDKNYFLKFANERAKKYSYAASFGISSLPKDYITEYKSALGDFAVCSVREKQGLEILSTLGIENRRIDLDPTMLLTKEDWPSQFNISVNPKQKYIFAYYFELTDSLRSYIEQLAKKTDCTVVFVGNPLKTPFRCRCKALKTADPIDFVNAIANAEYVVTNSFHGTAFSIIFNKKFYVEFLKTDAKVNSRIENILHTFSLENRIIGAHPQNDEVNWNLVNSQMSEMRRESLDYLKEILK